MFFSPPPITFHRTDIYVLTKHKLGILAVREKTFHKSLPKEHTGNVFEHLSVGIAHFMLLAQQMKDFSA